MASDKMPLILEDGMPMQLETVDDLFGDDVGLPLQVRPPSKQIQQRMDELRGRGACTTVAWSKSGTIATITKGGQDLELRCLRSHPADGSWDLSEPTVCGVVKGTPSNPLVHLDWAGTLHSELAVFDSMGRITLLIFSTSVTQPIVLRTMEPDALDETQTVAGSHWLQVTGAPPSQQAYNTLFGPATKVGNGFQYGNSFVHAHGPHHPHPSRSALLCVTVCGTLKMFWMQMNNKMEEVSLELESVNSTEESVTHVAFASDKKALVVAVATSAKNLRYIKIDVQWGIQQDKSVGAQGTRFNPTLTEKHIATTTWVPGQESIQEALQSELTQLHALPSVMDNSGKNQVPPVLVAIRARPSNSDFDLAAQTIIDRWEAIEQRQGQHDAISQLGSRRNSVTELPNMTRLRKQEPLVLNKCLINFQTLQFGKVVLLSFSDGSVEFRDRFTFEGLYTEQKTDKVMNLREVGWTYGDEEPSLQVAYSPTFCSMVQMGDDKKLRWRMLRHTDGDIGNTMEDPTYAATLACLTIAGATAIKYQSNFDDILAVARPLITKTNFMYDWLTELIRIVTINVDYSVEYSHDALMKNDQLRNCLGVMVNFGFKGDMCPRSFQSTHALLALHMRNIASEITLASNMPLHVGGKKSPLDDPDVVELLASAVKWSLDLFAWVADSLFELMNDDHFMELLTPQRANELGPYLHKKNDVSLHLLLCSSSRVFMSALCRRVGHLVALGHKAAEFYRRQSAVAGDAHNTNPRVKAAYQKLRQNASASMIDIAEFEKMVNALGAGITQAYGMFLPAMVKKSANPPQGKAEDDAVKAARSQLEARMLLSAKPPTGFIHVLKKFFTEDVPAFRKLVDPAKLFFTNFQLLDLDDDAPVKGVKSLQLDTISRAPVRMTPTGKWKRCTRCSTVMAETDAKGPGVTFLFAQQRKCPCNGTWAEAAPGKLVP